jgi:hypothetical protein
MKSEGFHMELKVLYASCGSRRITWCCVAPGRASDSLKVY